MASIDKTAAATAIDAFLRAIGRDPGKEPDLVGTGERVADAYVDELCAGYAIDTKKLVETHAIALTTGGSTPGALIIVRDIPVLTMCPHHLLPAVGTATVALEPGARLIGVGTVAALVEAYARRLTLQEHIGEGVVSDFEAVFALVWVGCRILLAHGCMIARGERALGSKVETIAMRGQATPERLLTLGIGAPAGES